MTSIKYLKTGNESLPFYWGMQSVAIFEELTGKNTASIYPIKKDSKGEMITKRVKSKDGSGFVEEPEIDSEAIRTNDIVAMIFAGLACGHRKAKKPFSIEIDDIYDMCDEDVKLLEKGMTLHLFFLADESVKKNPKTRKERRKEQRN